MSSHVQLKFNRQVPQTKKRRYDCFSDIFLSPPLRWVNNINRQHVFHFAASINLTAGYEDLKKINVGGTARVLEFAVNRKIKRLMHMSTEAVCSPDMIRADCSIPETTDLGDVTQVPQISSCNFKNGKITRRCEVSSFVYVRRPLCLPLEKTSLFLFFFSYSSLLNWMETPPISSSLTFQIFVSRFKCIKCLTVSVPLCY